MFSCAVSQYSIGMSNATDLFVNEVLKQVFSKRNLDFLNNRRNKFFMVALIGALNLYWAFLMSTVDNTLMVMFFFHNNGINSPILGLFLLSIFNPYANHVGAITAFFSNIAFNAFLAVGRNGGFISIKSQEFPATSHTFDCSPQPNVTITPFVESPSDPALYFLFTITGIWYCLFSLLFTFIVGSVLSFFYSLWASRSLDADSYMAEKRKCYLFNWKNARIDFNDIQNYFADVKKIDWAHMSKVFRKYGTENAAYEEAD